MVSKDEKEEAINKRIKELIDSFEEYTSSFKREDPFSGPSEYFYIKLIKEQRNIDYNSLFNREFIELLYATLASWGMHRMGPKEKGAKMNNFEGFEKCLLNNKELFIDLKSYRIEKINLEDPEIIEKIKRLYFGLNSLMQSNSKLVATTKIMHFLLPHLIPPMDREYTMKFFRESLPTIKKESDREEEYEIFKSILKKMAEISKKVNCKLDNEFSPSIPKAIDNAIVYWGIKNKRLRSSQK